MLKNILLFVTGAAIGSVVTYKIVEKKFKDLADEEIESVKEVFKKRNNTSKKNTDVKLIDTTIDKIEEISNGIITDYSKIVKDEEYSDGENENEEDYTVDLEENEERNIPIIIDPNEFGTIDHYGTKTLTYYQDDVLTDEVDNIINNRDDIIGPDALSRFGEYEDDAVHIRDIDNEMDYEILRVEKMFSGIARTDD